MKRSLSFVLGLVLVCSHALFAADKKKEPSTPSQNIKMFELDSAHSYVSFTAETLLFDVPGRFKQYDVKISGDPDTLDHAQVLVSIDTSSIDTNQEKRDAHLRSKDFFSVSEYPNIIFSSKSVKKQGDKLMVFGVLDMHGVKKELTIPFQAIQAPNGAGVLEHVYRGEFSISRKDFAIAADSLAAKISMKDKIFVHVLLAGFFNSGKLGVPEKSKAK